MLQNNLDPHAAESRDQYVEPGEERRAVQKRTFTRWMNVHLHRCEPPLCVLDLFVDIQDGRILMALLEELSGCKLLYRFRSSTHRIFRLSNISKALAFLDDRHVKLLGIDASGIADGVPAVVLHLVWNVILHFQIKEVTGGLRRQLSLSLSSLSATSFPPSDDDLTLKENNSSRYSCSTLPSEGRRSAGGSKYHGKEIRTLLHWLQRCTSKHGINVHDFGRSWRSGLAFLAMIKSISPDLVDLSHGFTGDAKDNMQRAFQIAQERLDVPPLLDPEDVISISDQKSILTYVSMFLGCGLAKEKMAALLLWMRRSAKMCVEEEEIQHTKAKIKNSPNFDVKARDYSNNFKVTAEIPNFGFLESVTYGETLADDPEAQTLLESMKTRSEQLLWKRWSKRSPVYAKARVESSSPLSSGTSFPKPFLQKTARGEGVLRPPSPLDAAVDDQQMQSWMVMDGNQRAYEMCLSALDSDEEDAYSYILHLNKETLEPNYQPKMVQIAKIEEETASEMIKELKTSTKLESSQITDSGPQLIDRKFDLNLKNREYKDLMDDSGGLDVESEEEVLDDEVQSNDDWGLDEWKIRSVRSGKKESEKMDEGVYWQIDDKEKEPKVQLKNCELMDEGKKQEDRELMTTFRREENMNAARMECVKDGKERKKQQRGTPESIERETDKSGSPEEDRQLDLSRFGHIDEDVGVVASDDVGSENRRKTKRGINQHMSTTPETPTSDGTLSSGTEFALRSLPSVCDISPLELELLFALWIVLYCCLILYLS